MTEFRAASTPTEADARQAAPLRWEDALDYELPGELIAQRPRPRRDAARLLVVDRSEGRISEARVRDLPQLLAPGDLVVANDSRVVRARLFARKPGGGHVELLIVGDLDGTRTEAMARGLSKNSSGTRLRLEDGTEARVIGRSTEGRWLVDFAPRRVAELLEAVGHVPIPPYIRRGRDESLDHTRYQTVYARHPGSVAAPTAGLHLTNALIETLRARGVAFETLTLHVGPATFAPLREPLETHRLEAERTIVPERVVDAVAAARTRGARVVAVGTTAVRALETAACAEHPRHIRQYCGATELFIRPGHRFRVVDALLTNFHLPRSSLLCLVFAFAGVELARKAYAEAVARRFRFYSYGDAMLIV